MSKDKEPNFLKKYRKADPDGRLSLMFENYKDFPKIIHKAEKKTTYKIKTEREFLRSHIRGELGVRVQTSKKSDPTADEAVDNVSLEEAFANGKICGGLLKGIENSSVYEADIRIISIMKMDYMLLQDIIEDLDEGDSKIIKDYLLEGKLYREMAVDEHISYDGIKKRMERIRGDIRDEIIECLEMNCSGGEEC